MSASYKLSLRGLQKSFTDAQSGKTVVAVESVSLDIPTGELVTLLGPSGCGKTTVLRMLAGFEFPTGGAILLDGRDVTGLPPNERNCAMVFQSYALFPHMTVLQNITYGLKFRRVSKPQAEQRLQRILEVVNLKGYEARRPHELSGGQQQRVALARALIIEPALLLFDEPLSNLDAKLREFMRQEIRKIQKELGITAVYVTHDQSEAMAISDRVVVMNKGKIEQAGKNYEVYHRPSTRFVADFMGAANFLEATFRASQGQHALVELAGSELKVPNRTAVASGASVTLVIRPEAVLLGQTGIAAKVAGYTFLGSQHEYAIELADKKFLTARVESSPEKAPIAVGENVRVAFDAERLTYLPA